MQIISKQNAKYNVDVESLRRLPINGHVFWKDINGRYLGSNDLMLEVVKVASFQDLLTKVDSDFDVLENELYMQQDKLVMQSGQSLHFLDSATTPELKIDFFSIKSPLLDTNGKLAGVWGYSSYLTEYNPKTFLPIFQDADITLKNFDATALAKLHIEKIVALHNLSKRQIQCLYCLAKAMTMKQIARKLDISARTVEGHLEVTKLKLNCKSRLELISKAHEMNLLKYPFNM